MKWGRKKKMDTQTEGKGMTDYRRRRRKRAEEKRIWRPAGRREGKGGDEKGPEG